MLPRKYKRPKVLEGHVTSQKRRPDNETIHVQEVGEVKLNRKKQGICNNNVRGKITEWMSLKGDFRFE